MQHARLPELPPHLLGRGPWGACGSLRPSRGTREVATRCGSVYAALRGLRSALPATARRRHPYDGHRSFADVPSREGPFRSEASSQKAVLPYSIDASTLKRKFIRRVVEALSGASLAAGSRDVARAGTARRGGGIVRWKVIIRGLTVHYTLKPLLFVSCHLATEIRRVLLINSH